MGKRFLFKGDGMKCPKCGSRVVSLWYMQTKPKYQKVETKFVYCRNCDKVFRVVLKEEI